MADRIRVEVVYAQADGARVVTLELEPGSRVGEAVRRSGLGELVDRRARGPALGIFGRPAGPDRVLADGDRVEIYRPLRVDPKEARRRRARAQRRR